MSSEVLGFWGRETISNVRRNKLMSLLAVSTVTIGLFVLGGFYLAWGCLQNAVDTQTKKLDIVAFLEPRISAKRRKEIYQGARIPQVAALELVSNDQALKEWEQELGGLSLEDFKKSSENPFGDELHLKLKNPEDIFKVRKYLASLKGVNSVRAPAEENAVKVLLSINKFIRGAGFVVFILLGMGILLIIYNAIRLTIFARRREINIMELVGATPAFIRVPFLMEGLIYGLIGAVAAAVMLVLSFGALTRVDMPFMPLFLPAHPAALLWKCLLWTFAAGLMFGLVGSWLSLSRSLNRAHIH